MEQPCELLFHLAPAVWADMFTCPPYVEAIVSLQREILRFTLFSRHVVFDGEGDKLRNKRIENHITVSVVIDMECGNTKN